MKIITLGSGFVSEHLPYEIVYSKLEISSESIEQTIDQYRPDVIINCIGKTGRPNIDWCESNKEKTSVVNTALPILLADICKKKSIKLIQIGSGCIFFGTSPHSLNGVDTGWKETDFANPISFYSKTKYACDLILGSMDHVTTLRIRMPVSYKNNHRNLINKLRGYTQIIDIPNSMTFMNDLVKCIDWVIKENKTGIYHVVNPEPVTAAQIMTEYQKYNRNHRFEIITEQQLDNLTIAKRSNCILNGEKLNKDGFNMTSSQEALEKCMREYCS